MKRTTIDIFQFMQYRQFFRAVYDDLKRKEKDFSFRSLQRKAGFSDRSNHFWQVLNGTVKLTTAAAERYAKALGLTAKEKEHLQNMLALEQANSEEEREAIIVRMLSSSSFLSGNRYQMAALALFSDWVLPILWEVVALDNFKEDPVWIAQNFFTDITPAEVTVALEKLLIHGFVSRDATGKLKQEQINLSDYLAASRETSAAIITMRKAQLRKTMVTALEAMDSQPFEKRLFYSSSIPVSKETYEEMKQRILSFQDDLRAISLKNPARDAVYQFNIQFYAPFSE